MFGNAYQNGQFFQVWDSKVNPDKNQLYKQLFKVVPASSKKYFDKEVKSYIYSLEGQVGKMVLPASDSKDLSLHQKYLVLHLFIPHGYAWSMEMGLTDISNTKRRINITSTQGKQETKYFSLRYPLAHLERGVWLFLGINVYSFMEAFKDQVFRSLDHLQIGSNCLIRRIFTMKEWNHWEIPKGFWFPGEVQQEFQLIEYSEHTSLPKILMSKGSAIAQNQSEPVTSLYEKLTPNKRQSKQALGKSEISPTQITRSKVYNIKPMSLEPIMRSKPSPESKAIQDSKIKLRLNSMKDEAQFTSVLKKEKVQKTQKVSNRSIFKNEVKQFEIKSQSSPNKKLVSSPPTKSREKKSLPKSPIIEKSFQEDEGLAAHDSSFNFETSNETIIHKEDVIAIAKSAHNEEKWSSSEGEEKMRSMKAHPTSMVKQKMREGRTEVVKENKEMKTRVVEPKVMKKQELELIYDEMVGCYYHPETHMYYEIKN